MSARDPNDPFGDGWGVVVLVIAVAMARLPRRLFAPPRLPLSAVAFAAGRHLVRVAVVMELAAPLARRPRRLR